MALQLHLNFDTGALSVLDAKKLMLGLLSFALYCQPSLGADSLLTRMQQNSIQQGRNATLRERQIQGQVDKDTERAAAEAQSVLDRTKKAFEQDIIDGKLILIQELTCTIKNLKNNLEDSGAIRINVIQNEEKRIFLPLRKIFPNDVDRGHLAIAFLGSLKNDNLFSFLLVDLNNGQVVKRSENFADLGLSDVNQKCSMGQRFVSSAQDNASANADGVLKKLANPSDSARDAAQRLPGQAPVSAK